MHLGVVACQLLSVASTFIGSITRNHEAQAGVPVLMMAKVGVEETPVGWFGYTTKDGRPQFSASGSPLSLKICHDSASGSQFDNTTIHESHVYVLPDLVVDRNGATTTFNFSRVAGKFPAQFLFNTAHSPPNAEVKLPCGELNASCNVESSNNNATTQEGSHHQPGHAAGQVSLTREELDLLNRTLASVLHDYEVKRHAEPTSATTASITNESASAAHSHQLHSSQHHPKRQVDSKAPTNTSSTTVAATAAATTVGIAPPAQTDGSSGSGPAGNSSATPSSLQQPDGKKGEKVVIVVIVPHDDDDDSGSSAAPRQLASSMLALLIAVGALAWAG